MADRFYPGNSSELRHTVTNLLAPFEDKNITKALAVVSPHAGYIYSGSVAAETLGSITIPSTVVILGLNHHGQGSPVALSRSTWQMPLGAVEIDEEFTDIILDQQSPIREDEVAHKFEHSVEVQIPFLQLLIDFNCT